MAKMVRQTNDDELIILDRESENYMKYKSEAKRLEYMPLFVSLLMSILLLAWALAEQFLPRLSLFVIENWKDMALYDIIQLALLPLVVITLAIILFRPQADLLKLRTNKVTSVLAAVALGIMSAFLYYVLLTLLSSVNILENQYLLFPKLLTDFSPNLQGSAAETLAAVLIAAVMPAIIFVLMIHGLVLSSLAASNRQVLASFLVALLAALLPLDAKGLIAYFVLWLILNRIYLCYCGLFSSFMAAVSYLLALMWAPQLFNLLNSRFIIFQTASTRQYSLLLFALTLILLILTLSLLFHFNLLRRNQRRAELALSLQPHIIKHKRKTESRPKSLYFFLIVAIIIAGIALFIKEYL